MDDPVKSSLGNRTSDLELARQALFAARTIADGVEDPEARVRSLTMVADGYRRLVEASWVNGGQVFASGPAPR